MTEARPNKSISLSPLMLFILVLATWCDISAGWAPTLSTSKSALPAQSMPSISIPKTISPLQSRRISSCNLRNFVLSSAIVPQEIEEADTQPPKKEHECSACKVKFPTRNALFRHLRGEDDDLAAVENCPVASSSAMAGSAARTEKELTMTAVVRYGYVWKENATNDDNLIGIEGKNDFIAIKIQEEFIHLANCFLAQNGADTDGTKSTCDTSPCTTSALTYSTAAKLRQPSLMQDKEIIGATSEALSFNYKLSLPSSRNLLLTKKWKNYVASGKLLEDLRGRFDERNNSDQPQYLIALHSMDAMVPRSYKFYAERSCSQRSYRFLFPLSWLLQDVGLSSESRYKLLQWWKTTASIPNEITNARKHQPRGGRQQGKPSSFHHAPDCITRLKHALKAAESRTVDPKIKQDGDSEVTEGNEEFNELRPSPGRFGQLWRKERRCWSNFADPKLPAMARSPGHESVWRTIDKARIVGFAEYPKVDNSEGSEIEATKSLESMHAILEFRGDGFVLGQIPKLVSTVVSIANGWLSDDFIDISTRTDTHVITPSTPPSLGNRLYFHSSRYHFHELIGNTGGLNAEKTVHSEKKNFEDMIRGGSVREQEWEVEMRNSLLAMTFECNNQTENDWLLNLRDVEAPEIRRQLDKLSTCSNDRNELPSKDQINEDRSFQAQNYSPAPPGGFTNTLRLLRSVVDDGRWPATSGARSRVIKSPQSCSNNILATKKGAVASAFPGMRISSGSFTVINEELWQCNSEIPRPLGNSLFPELAKAVFDLEKEIVRTSNPPLPSAHGMKRLNNSYHPRQPSTHCAVNRNAQFTPHVDSGRGQGQTLSMIVGLGDYSGGEILVENRPYEIRYKPLEFDGWKQLHWTAPFQGERYSLVWFSPEVKKQPNGSSENLDESLSEEDERAIRLANHHSANVPYLPLLQFRVGSTDSLVVNEILDRDKKCAYIIPPNELFGDFSLNEHDCILDIGAHIGIFSRFAIEAGCKHIIAYEPEPSNFDLLEKNLSVEDLGTEIVIDIHKAAVVHDSRQLGVLIQARNQNDGKKNTWRHSLLEYSQYVDRTTKLPSESQKSLLERIPVKCVPFFGFRKGEENEIVKPALVPGVTFVKLDCEGSEIDILLSHAASQESSWLDVTHFVMEWSFTKERRGSVFRTAMSNLREAGFEVFYQGMGSWWEAANVMWPYPNDLIVFAKKIKQTR
mmetsp:Transcript_18089/g.37912  ORF Transcript_18089/g.37912 Transcript_18089/m.37912 type:complete len:1196 (-) Transcript_18089:78-3665(-)